MLKNYLQCHNTSIQRILHDILVLIITRPILEAHVLNNEEAMKSIVTGDGTMVLLTIELAEWWKSSMGVPRGAKVSQSKNRIGL